MKNNFRNDDEIPFWRKFMFYGGKIVSTFGMILFFSSFFLHSGNLNPLRPIAAICMIFSGNVSSNVGKKGLAGSGILLNPKKEREDLKPFSKAGGEILKDVMDEYKKEDRSESENVTIKIKCQNCGALNDEDARFCSNCGKKL